MTAVRFENRKRIIRRWNRVFDALSAEPRRQLIVSLLDRSADESISLPEAAVNPNAPPDPEELRRDLYHRHLPMLEEGQFVEWETDPLTAVRGSRFDEVAVVLESLQATATDIPDSLVVGCQRLERERRDRSEDH